MGSSARGEALELPCGKCVGCRMDRSRSWSIRIGHEAQGWDSNVFVTLDYSPDRLSSWSLVYRDWQLFMKRLRRRFSGVSFSPDGTRPIRFFVAGEYGARFRRPHWHAILFNLSLRDREEFANGTFRSESLERCWGNGHCVVGDVTPESSAYVAGYTQSKVDRLRVLEETVDLRTGEWRQPEMARMSNQPGVGGYWYRKFSGDLFPLDKAVQAGKDFKVPRYYWEKFRRSHPLQAEEVAYERYLRSRAMDPEESTPERRQVREAVAEARVRFFSQRDH